MWTEAIGIINVFDQTRCYTVDIQIGTPDEKIIGTIAECVGRTPTYAFVAEQLPGGDLVLRKVPIS